MLYGTCENETLWDIIIHRMATTRMPSKMSKQTTLGPDSVESCKSFKSILLGSWRLALLVDGGDGEEWWRLFPLFVSKKEENFSFDFIFFCLSLTLNRSWMLRIILKHRNRRIGNRLNWSDQFLPNWVCAK